MHVTDRREFRPFLSGAAVIWASHLLAPGNFVYVDESVYEGESYVYKIVPVAYVEDWPPVESEEPFAAPIEVPTFVEFTLERATSTSARFICTRPSPEQNDTLVHTFTVPNGLQIGGIQRKRLWRKLANRPRYEYNFNVDFSTNCVLVSGLPDLRQMTYDVEFARGGVELNFDLEPERIARALYLTPSGRLRIKQRFVGEAEGRRPRGMRRRR
jgi:hypothetical protein